MFKKIGFLALLMLCVTISIDAQTESKEAQRKARLKEMKKQRKEAERAAKGKKTKELEDEEDNDVQVKRGWPEWLVVGAAPTGGYSNGWNLGITPWVGYKVSDRFWVGPGLDYVYSSFKPRGSNINRTFSVVGPKIHTCFYITPAFSVGSEYAFNRFTYTETINNIKYKESGPSNTWLIGGGYTQRTDRFGVRAEVFYDALWESTEVVFRSSPLVFRLNLIYGF